MCVRWCDLISLLFVLCKSPRFVLKSVFERLQRRKGGGCCIDALRALVRIAAHVVAVLLLAIFSAIMLCCAVLLDSVALLHDLEGKYIGFTAVLFCCFLFSVYGIAPALYFCAPHRTAPHPIASHRMASLVQLIVVRLTGLTTLKANRALAGGAIYNAGANEDLDLPAAVTAIHPFRPITYSSTTTPM